MRVLKAFFIAFFAVFFGACGSEKPLVLNEPSPQIATMDLNGNAINLSDFKGKAIAMVFFKNGCEACVGLLPALDGISSERLAILAINASNSKDEIRDLLADMPLPKTHILRDSLNITTQRFLVTMTPTVILLDSSHIVRDRIVGAEDFNAIKSKIEAIL